MPEAFFVVATPLTYFLIVAALSALVEDHLHRGLPAPWGHVLWHLLAAAALTSFLSDMIQSIHL